jgi:hypothetical protein
VLQDLVEQRLRLLDQPRDLAVLHDRPLEEVVVLEQVDP